MEIGCRSCTGTCGRQWNETVVPMFCSFQAKPIARLSIPSLSNLFPMDFQYEKRTELF
jgi:hypothetical protein